MDLATYRQADIDHPCTRYQLSVKQAVNFHYSMLINLISFRDKNKQENSFSVFYIEDYVVQTLKDLNSNSSLNHVSICLQTRGLVQHALRLERLIQISSKPPQHFASAFGAHGLPYQLSVGNDHLGDSLSLIDNLVNYL